MWRQRYHHQRRQGCPHRQKDDRSYLLSLHRLPRRSASGHSRDSDEEVFQQAPQTGHASPLPPCYQGYASQKPPRSSAHQEPPRVQWS